MTKRKPAGTLLPPGRLPVSTYTKAIGDTICTRLIGGETLRRICQDENMPARSTVYEWLASDKDFSAQYSMAMERRAEVWAEEVLEIADDTTGDTIVTEQGARMDKEFVQRSKLRVDARMFLMSKAAPKRYGAKAELDVNHKHSFEAMPDDELQATIAGLLAKAGGKA
jgi:hypothetical protein